MSVTKQSINIQEVNLDIEISRAKVGIVAMHSKLNLSDVGPFRCQNQEEQLKNIERTLSVSMLNDHGADHTLFTIFPEYSVPGVAGIELIDSEVNKDSWPKNSVVIGGIDGLEQTELKTLIEKYNIKLAGTSIDEIPKSKWINCFMLWAKTSDGKVQRFIQFKILGALPEEATACAKMHGGKSIFLFNCRFDNEEICRFISLICYDWIGRFENNEPLLSTCFESLCEIFKTDGMNLNWLFVLQNNPKPNHDEFLIKIKDFFQERSNHSQINRDSCAAFFINTAGKEQPGECEEYGCSAIILSPSLVNPRKISGEPHTYSASPCSKRKSTILQTCNDIVFRECGACIHSWSMTPPKFISHGVQNRHLPLCEAIVHPLKKDFDDPRVPAASVPGIIKWINDILDKIDNLSQRVMHASLKDVASSNFDQQVSKLRYSDSNVLDSKISKTLVKNKKNPSDEWESHEINALKTLIDAVTIIGLMISLQESNSTHGQFEYNGQKINLISVCGNDHEECLKYAREVYTSKPHEFLLVVSRDLENTEVMSREKKITEKLGTPNITDERLITDTDNVIIHKSFQTVLNTYIQSNNLEKLKEQLDGLFK